MPNVVTFEDGSTVTYTYAADGTKLRTLHNINGTTTQTDYTGSVLYENGIPKSWMTEAGYISMDDSKYHYYLQDHQGNNRVVVSETGAVEEVNHYYAFGGLFGNNSSVQPFKYNGKELDTKKGLNWYDYGARQYDAALGRWFAVDPLAEKYYHLSPYIYCNNLPVRYIDLKGEDWKEAKELFAKSASLNIYFGVRAGLSLHFGRKNIGLDINAGSVELGYEGKRLTKGVSVEMGLFYLGREMSAYYENEKSAVLEEKKFAGFILWENSNVEKTTYDCTGKYFEEKSVDAFTESEMSFDIGASAALGVGFDINFDLKLIIEALITFFE